jgi:thioredoxin-like negative regulator of GroEL
MNTPVYLVNSECQAAHPELVVINCWADWCARSQSITPLIDQITEEYKDRIKVIKLNIDEHPTIAGKLGLLGISSIPVTFIFKAGTCIDEISGDVSYEALHAAIDKHLRNGRSVH